MKEYIIKIDESKHDIMGSVPLLKPPKKLVRCKECKWHTMEGEMLICKMEDKPHTYDWYCAGGSTGKE